MKKKEKRTFKQFFMDNNKRNLKITITVVCVVLALAIIGGGIYIGNKLGLITIDHGSNGDPEGTFAPEEQFDAMSDVSDASLTARPARQRADVRMPSSCSRLTKRPRR